MGKRRRYTERQVLECAIRQGAVIPCYRCKTPFTVETVKTAEREHIHELKLGGADTIENCAYSCRACHALVTNGNGHTSAGSSKNRIAKTTNPDRVTKFQVQKRDPSQPRAQTGRRWASRPFQQGKTKWPKRPIRARP
jgi:hypothetical protein